MGYLVKVYAFVFVLCECVLYLHYPFFYCLNVLLDL